MHVHCEVHYMCELMWSCWAVEQGKVLIAYLGILFLASG